MIKVEHITRSYGTFRAVSDVSFEIGRGEVVGLLGHNGAGKTTIMKMLTGFLEPSAGRIELDGLDIAEDLKAVQARIGYLPENCPVYPEMTVIDYLDFQAGLQGIKETERPAAIGQAIRRTRLEPKAEASIETLSRGYRQRVGVAQAILNRPNVLILDEPTNGLDPTQIEHMRELIQELSAHATVLISTHILQEVQAVCDRVLILRSSELVLDARLEDLNRSGRLLLSLDRPPEQALPVLSTVAGVADVAATGNAGGQYDYALALDSKERNSAAPAVARTATEQGFQLFSLQQESRNLETVFRDIENGKTVEVTRG